MLDEVDMGEIVCGELGVDAFQVYALWFGEVDLALDTRVENNAVEFCILLGNAIPRIRKSFKDSRLSLLLDKGRDPGQICDVKFHR